MSGVSVFAYDPGVGSGWAWACVGSKELSAHGGEGALMRARDDTVVRHGSLGDTRYRYGQINPMQGDVEAAQDLIIQAVVCGHMGNRVSAGRVPHLTHIVGESFDFREKTKSRHMLAPIRVGMGVECFMVMQNDLRNTEFCHQSPSDKSIITDDRLRDWGFWLPGKANKDIRDAIRHLIVKLRSLANA